MNAHPSQHKRPSRLSASDSASGGSGSSPFAGMTFKVLTWGMTSMLSLYAAQSMAATASTSDSDTHAETTNNELPTVNVVSTALSDTTEGTGLWTTGTTTSSIRLPMSVRETPQSVSVITDQRMKDRNMTSLEDVMRDVTGVNVMTDTGGRYHFESRGFKVQNVQQDGANGALGALDMNSFESALDTPDMAIYDHIEVLRGASGLTQGSGEPGGSVNLVRKRPTDKFQASTSMTVGSWGTRRNEADISGPIGLQGRLRGRAVIVNEDRGTPKSEVDSDRTGFFGALEYELDDHTRVGAGVYRQRTHTVPDVYGLPRSSSGEDLGLSRSTFLGASWNKAQYDRLDLFTDIAHDFDNGWAIKGTLNYTQSKLDSKYGSTFGSVDGSGNRVLVSGASGYDTVQQRHNTADQTSLNINATGPFSFLGRQHDLVLGTDISVDSYDANTQSANYSYATNIYDRINGKDIVAPQGYSSRSSWHYLERKQAVYATGRFSLTDDVKLILGSRLTEYSFHSVKRISDTDSHKKQHGVFTPYAGMTWDFLPSWTAYVSYTDIFQPQTSIGVDGNYLDPVVGKSYETGVKGSIFDGALNGSIALFRIDQKNRATPVSGNVCQDGTDDCYETHGLVRSQGVEVELAGSPTDNLTLGGGYTYNDIRYKENETNYSKGDRAFGYTPRHILRLYGKYQLPGELNKWDVGAGMSMQSGTQSNKVRLAAGRYETVNQGGYTTFDASVTYHYNEHLDISLLGNNLTDKRYYETYSNSNRYGYNFYGDPRNVALRATLRY
ncbi:TonB-dependent siderophore receptor [Zymobacter sp. IVIA_5232.4 C2]|uniref:TonB-dependent siderophore receptor n=1 Tax=Zymobacter sp. IVIA_5232.4 C2 TaxID=3394855 RepID=UPI0039C2610F